MAFLVYFFVLLVMAASILFGLDWAKAPLQAPASHRSAQTAATPRAKAERAAQQKPLAAIPLGRAEAKPPATSGMGTQPEPVTQDQQTTSPAPAERTQAAASPPPVKADPPPVKAEAHEQPPPSRRINTERSTVGVAAQETRSETQRDVQQHQKASAKDKKASSKAEARTRSESRRHASRRKMRDERDADVPDWAIRGAQAAQREAEYDRRAEAPPWAVRGAEAAQREYGRGGPPGPSFVPFWERNEGWHFR